MDLEPGQRIGGNVLVECLGPHEATEVWRARNSGGQAVTLRAGRIRGRSPDSIAERLEADLAIASRAQHPNIVRVLGAGVEDGWYYIVSEPVDGLLLSAILHQARVNGPWPTPHLAGYIVHQLARALSYVHEIPGPDGQPIGALHRDLTPDVIMVDRHGLVRLAELVSSLDSQDLLETAGPKRSGRVAYVSPESVANAHRDARTDVFALGAIFWELLTGEAPFVRGSDLETLEALRTADIPPLPTGIPAELAKIAQRCLHRDPNDRFESPWAIAQALQITLEGRAGAGPRSLALLLRELEAPHETKRAKTARLSAASQGVVVAETLAPTPVPKEATSSEAEDPFFDPMRDAGGLEHTRFELLGRLGSGAMGEVYKVRDRELDEIVALKRIPAETADSKLGLERLKREVRLARRIASDNVCRIFDIVDLGGGERGLTMAVIEGMTLSDLMHKPLETDYNRIARWGAEIADGLAAAHGLNIIHRDLKPENIMIQKSDDRAILLDFGIARPLDEEEADPKLTQAGIIMGTPLYMSPEQLANAPLDGRSDLYSLGLILAELVTGEVPLQGRSYSEILDRRVRQTAMYRLTDVDPSVPHDFGDLVDGLLSQASSNRPATATTVKERLRAFAAGRALGRDVVDAGEGPIHHTPLPHLVPAATQPAPQQPLVSPPYDMQEMPLEYAEVEAAPQLGPRRFLVPALLLIAIAVLLSFLVLREPRAVAPGPQRLGAERLPTEAQPTKAVKPLVTDAGQTAKKAQDAGQTPQPEPKRPKKRRPRSLQPVEEM